MRVIFAIPALSGAIHVQCMVSLMAAQKLLDLKRIEHDLHTISNCPYLTVARDGLVAGFLQDPENTDLFFIDSDVGFDASAVLKILERSEELVAGIYPLKQDGTDFPVRIMQRDGHPLGRDGLIEAELLPTGFMRVKRSVFEKLAAAYPELRYADSVVRVDNAGLKDVYNFFGMGVMSGRFTTEDYAFCKRWTAIGGQAWVYPNIDFQHVGMKAYTANYHEFLLRCPGGSKCEQELLQV